MDMEVWREMDNEEEEEEVGKEMRMEVGWRWGRR